MESIEFYGKGKRRETIYGGAGYEVWKEGHLCGPERMYSMVVPLWRIGAE